MNSNPQSIADKFQLNSFQSSHLLSLVESYTKTKDPIHLFLRKYLKLNRSIGSRDRKIISESLFFLIRFQGLIDTQIEKPVTWALRIFSPFCLNKEQPPHIQVSFAKWLFQRIEDVYGIEKALEICKISNTQAPITIRVNTLNTTKEAFAQEWSEAYPLKECEMAKNALTFLKKENFLIMPPFKKGLFEVQDEGSQLIAEMLKVPSKSNVLDFCAGSGGKSLAIAASMQNKGQIFLHDIRKGPLLEAKKRLARAGVQNAQLLSPEKLKKNLYNQYFSHILLDVPCSGSGTFRRNPDHKWRLTEEMIAEYVKIQREICMQSLKHLKPNGHILYATCSIFPEENQKQKEWFLDNAPVSLVKEKILMPTFGKWDGFYGALFTYTAS